jgi:signal transduction histidine kinase
VSRRLWDNVERLRELAVAALVFAVTAALALAVVHSIWSNHRLLHPWPVTATALLPAASFVAVGSMVWRRPGTARSGVLMCGVGLAWLASYFGFATNAYLFTLGSLLTFAYTAIFAHLLLAFPYGRPRSPVARWLIGVSYAAAFGLELTFLVLAPGRACEECPRNVLALGAHPAVAQAVATAGRVTALVLIATVTGMLATRWRTASPPRRIGQGPVLLTAVAALSASLVDEALVLVESVSGWAPEPLVVWFVAPRVVWALVPVGFLLGLVRSHLARAAIADLLPALDSSSAPRAVQEALMGALRDPTLRLYVWVPDLGGCLDADGREVDLPERDERRMTTIDRDGRRLGFLAHDEALREEPQLLSAAAKTAQLALENLLLRSEASSTRRALAASRGRLLAAATAERVRIERDLHDGAQQRLVAASILVGRARTVASTNEAVVARLDEAAVALADALRHVRRLADALYPSILTEQGLRAALDELAATTPIALGVDWQLPASPPAHLAQLVHEIATAGLDDAVRHAATAVRLQLRTDDEGLVVDLVVEPPGVVEPERMLARRSLAYRIRAAGGEVSTGTTASRGVRTTVRLPDPGSAQATPRSAV